MHKATWIKICNAFIFLGKIFLFYNLFHFDFYPIWICWMNKAKWIKTCDFLNIFFYFIPFLLIKISNDFIHVNYIFIPFGFVGCI